MRFLQFFRTNSSNKDAGDLQPKVQEGVGTVVEPCDGKRNASSARIKESEACQIAAKSLRLKLDVSASNSWDLRVVWQSIYIKYMHIYKGISDKGINEKRKKGYPVITNFKHFKKKCFGVILMPLADGEK